MKFLLWTIRMIVLSCTSFVFAQDDLQYPLELIKSLEATQVLNMKEVVQNLDITPDHRVKGFSLNNPYMPRIYKNYDDEGLKREYGINNFKLMMKRNKVMFYHQQKVHDWALILDKDIREEEVCGVKFIDAQKKKYKLQTFQSKYQAWESGYQVTHQFHCGACSSLRDLAAYIRHPNMTDKARKCSKKLSMAKTKNCYEKEVGFSPLCSEAWAYNSWNTRKSCMKICLRDYGFVKTLLGRFPASHNTSEGRLTDCVLCDELRSGPGFKYAAGRNRRGSGLTSAIEREEGELYDIDHSQYFAQAVE